MRKRRGGRPRYQKCPSTNWVIINTPASYKGLFVEIGSSKFLIRSQNEIKLRMS